MKTKSIHRGKSDHTQTGKSLLAPVAPKIKQKDTMAQTITRKYARQYAPRHGSGQRLAREKHRPPVWFHAALQPCEGLLLGEGARHLDVAAPKDGPVEVAEPRRRHHGSQASGGDLLFVLERETGLEPATLSLEG